MPLLLLACLCLSFCFPAHAFAYGLTPERFDCSNSQRYYVVRVPSPIWPDSIEVAQTYSDAGRIDLAGRWEQGLPIWDYGEQYYCDLAFLPSGTAATASSAFELGPEALVQHGSVRMHTFDANADGIQEIALTQYVDGGFYEIMVLGGCPDNYYIPVAQFVAFRAQYNGNWVKPEDVILTDSANWPEFVVEAPAQVTGRVYSKQKNWAVRHWRFNVEAGTYTQTIRKRLPEQ